MKKHLLVLLLALGCSAAMANWVRLSASETSVYYVEAPLPPKVGTNVMVWVLRDHAEALVGAAGPFLSSKDQIEIDCNGRRVRRIYSSDQLEHMGQGRQVHFEHGPMSWNFASPNTILKRIVDMACVPS